MCKSLSKKRRVICINSLVLLFLFLRWWSEVFRRGLFLGPATRHCYCKAQARTHTLASREAQHFCCLEAVKFDNAHRRIAERSCRIYSNTTHAAVVPHLRPEPLTYLLTKLGTYAAPHPHPTLPAHENTPSARAQPDNMNMTIHTLRAGRKNTGGQELGGGWRSGWRQQGSQAQRV